MRPYENLNLNALIYRDPGITLSHNMYIGFKSMGCLWSHTEENSAKLREDGSVGGSQIKE